MSLLDAFEAKYVQKYQLGQGGYGSVFAGYRQADKVPVAIKHIPKIGILFTVVVSDQNPLLFKSVVVISAHVL